MAGKRRKTRVLKPLIKRLEIDGHEVGSTVVEDHRENGGPVVLHNKWVCAACKAWESRYHELVKELLAMKRDGFSPAGSSATPPAAAELPEEVRKAIREVSEPGDITWRRLTKEAWELLREDNPEEVANRIRAGEPASL